MPLGVIAVLVLCAGALVWWFMHREQGPPELTLYGNVDLREVNLAFNNNERITTIDVHEGDRVARGQVVAKVDTSRLVPQVAQAAANVELAKVDVANSNRQYNRLKLLTRTSDGRGVSTQDLDNARAAMDTAIARQHASEAQLALLQQQLKDADLIAPVTATVRSRIMEPGEMASPQRPVLSLAITDPKWVRVYVAEPDLPKVRPGMIGCVTVDGYPNHGFSGWVGFVSSVAEFTPKTIETTELRTSLVYEVRMFVKDPGDVLRLGMPATVHLALSAHSLPECGG
jgi:HlyD family secretion protein